MALPQTDGPMSLLFDVWLVNGLSAGYLDEVLSGTGLSGTDFGMYALLHRFGPTTPTQLRRWTGQPLTTVSAHLKRIERRGHLDRTTNPGDGRSQLVGLSREGVAAHDAATAPFLAAMHELRALLPDALTQRMALQGIDSALRALSGMDPRPYGVTHEDPPVGRSRTATHALSYVGEPLTAEQERQVRLFLDFVRTRS